MQRVADDAIAKAKSDEVRDTATALSTTAKKAAHDFTESKVGRRIISTAQAAASEVLDNLAAGDSVSQATAKTAKTQVQSRNPSRGAGSKTADTKTEANEVG